MFTGHPKGLFRLFFIEMWERLAFYTMVGVLLLYATNDGGLGWSQDEGNEIYGLYLAFVYFTPYVGGMLADRFLGYRRSVLLGGLLFATGFFLLATQQPWAFPAGLVFLCLGNGFFKPTISAMVGNLYEKGDPKRDAGFNIFYMGINIGALFANFLAAYMRNTVGWYAIFVAAGCGMLISVAILLSSWKVLAKADRTPGTNPEDTPFSEIASKILGPALIIGVAGWWVAGNLLPEAMTKLVKPTDFGFLLGSIPILLFFARLSNKANEEEKPGLKALLPIYLAGGTFFMVLHLNGSAMTTWANENTARQLGQNDPIVLIADTFRINGDPVFAGNALPGYYANAADDIPRPNKLTLLPLASSEQEKMFGQKKMGAASLTELSGKLPLGVAVVDLPMKGALSAEQEKLEKFSVEIFDKVEIVEGTDSHGMKSISVKVDGGSEAKRRVAFVRTDGDSKYATYLVSQESFDKLYEGDPPQIEQGGEYLRTANAELYQSWNAFFVVFMTPLIMLFFARLLKKGVDFSTARKILSGMVVTGIAAILMMVAGFTSDNGAVKVSGMWLMGFYALITVGELFLSPMALSLVTKLSPRRFVGLTMGGWFFATAVGNKFSGFLGVLQGSMEPAWFFLVIACAAGAVALYILSVLPKLDSAIKKYGA
ncbi:MAG: dipeptide/tripeptide permease [Planctomycetota bacterium]|jgi:dipeptide/tripeptide permease